MPALEKSTRVTEGAAGGRAKTAVEKLAKKITHALLRSFESDWLGEGRRGMEGE
jgi:hypothetical protein